MLKYVLVGVIFLMGALTYLAVPLYRIYCEIKGYGYGSRGSPSDLNTLNYSDSIDKNKIITISFDTNVSPGSSLEFIPLTTKLDIVIGELAMAVFRVKNTGLTTTGVATYNVNPPEVGVYLNKVQCFCFDEQIFFTNDIVEMPVLFYIDENFLNDPYMYNVENINLSYTLHDALSVSTIEQIELLQMLFEF